MSAFEPIAEGDRGRYDWIGTAISFFVAALPITFISQTVIQRLGLTLEHFLPLFEHPAFRISVAVIGGLIVWGNIREKKDTSIYVVSKRSYSSAEIDTIMRGASITQTPIRITQFDPHNGAKSLEGFWVTEMTPEGPQHLLAWRPEQASHDHTTEDDDEDFDEAWEDEYSDEKDSATDSPVHTIPSGGIRLSVELVPRSCWFSNLRSALGPERWKPVARAVSKNANHRCEICGGRGPQWPVEAHETWEYDDASKVQRLTTIRALCPSCHEVKHFGLASIKGRKEIAFNHLMKINEWSRQSAEGYVLHEFDVWRERSEKSWTLNLSELSRYGFSMDEIKQLENSERSRRDKINVA